MNAREQALLGYVGTLAAEPAVRQAISRLDLNALLAAVWDCLGKDLPTVGRVVLRTGIAAAAEMARPRARATADRLVDTVAGHVDGFLDQVFGERKR